MKEKTFVASRREFIHTPKTKRKKNGMLLLLHLKSHLSMREEVVCMVCIYVMYV